MPRDAILERSERRLKAFLVVEVSARGETTRGYILDLSSGGAKLHSTLQVAVGHAVAVRVASTAITGRVTWTGESRFGLRFTQALVGETIDRLLSGS